MQLCKAWVSLPAGGTRTGSTAHVGDSCGRGRYQGCFHTLPYPGQCQVSMAQGMRKWPHRVGLKLCLCSPPATSSGDRRRLLGRPGILQSDSPLAFYHQLSARQEEQPEAQPSQRFSSQLLSPAFAILVQRPEASLPLSWKAELKTLTWLASTS